MATLCTLYPKRVCNGNYFEGDKEMVIDKLKEEMIGKSNLYLNIQNDLIIGKMKQAARIRSD